MREYELTVVFDLAVAEAGGADAAPNHVDTLIAARGGTVLKHDHWGRRRMAYPINRAVDGDYVVSRVELDPAQVTPLEAVMRIDERIYRHLIVRADELPVPPPPREPRRIPGEGAIGDQPSAAGDEQPAASVAAADAVASPSTVVAEPAEAEDETVEPVVSAVDEAAVTPAAAEEAEPEAAADAPATEAVAAEAEAEPLIAEAEPVVAETEPEVPAATTADPEPGTEESELDPVDNAEPATDNSAEVESTDRED